MKFMVRDKLENKKIGILGGSFDPAHSGHVHITKTALTCFDLDEIWWLVSPANPLKKNAPASLEKRVQNAQALMRHPRVRISAIEATLETQYTSETLKALARQFPNNRFVWLMGADNLEQFHKWHQWKDIIETVPLGILARPGNEFAQKRAKTAQIYANFKLPSAQSRILSRRLAPAWCFKSLPLNPTSSTQLRSLKSYETR